MQELAQATFTYEQFPEVMSMLWKRMLQENKRNWRRTYKVSSFLLYIYICQFFIVFDYINVNIYININYIYIIFYEIIIIDINYSKD